MSAQKVLVTGPISSLSSYFTKLASLQSKHSFNLVIAQDLFSSIDNDDKDLDDLLNGTIQIPVQVYAAVGKGKLPQKVQDKVDKGEELTNNLSVLPKAGLLTLASGLRIATLSGSAPSDSPSSFTTSDVSSLLSSFQPTVAPTVPSISTSSVPAIPSKPADILLTHLVPSSLTLMSSKTLTPSQDRPYDQVFSPLLDEPAKLVRSKYHFVSSVGKFWEREPFEWPIEEGSTVGEPKSYCRALSLGEMGNKEKERWFYAFSITPKQPSSAPPNSTKSPFHPARLSDLIQTTQTLNGTNGPRGLKRPAQANEDDVNEMGVPNYIFSGQKGSQNGRDNGKKGKGGPPPDHYTCRICDQKGHWIQDCPDKESKDAERASQRTNKGP
ncbi:hypothetical protein JCM5353_001234, partial [Sporobolomyces roseus]